MSQILENDFGAFPSVGQYGVGGYIGLEELVQLHGLCVDEAHLEEVALAIEV
jgi:hypothetical protein